jgi:signal transduction histidine kinase/integral membrane sensor domain MASE1
MPPVALIDDSDVRPVARPDDDATSAYPSEGRRSGTDNGPQGWSSAGFALTYFVAGLLGRWTAPDDGQLVLVAPAAGVAVVWLLASRNRVLDAGLLAAAAGGYHAVTLSDLTAVPLHVAVALVQTTVAVLLLRRLVPEVHALGSPGAPATTGMVWRLVVASLLSALVGGTVLVVGLSGIAPELEAVSTWLSYLGRNVTSLTVIVMLAHLLAACGSDGRWTRISRSEQVTSADAALVTAVVYVTVFVASDLPLAFLPMLVTLWVASRSTPLVAALHATASGMGATLMTTLGHGPFHGVSDEVARAGIVQTFVFALFVTALVVSAQRQQQGLASDELRRQRERAEDQSTLLTAVLDSLSEAVLVLGADGRPTLANRPGRRWLEAREEVRRRTGALQLLDNDGHPFDPADLPSARALRGEEVIGVEVGLRDAAGEWHVHAVTAVPLRTGDPEAAAVLVHRDVTEARAQQDRLSAFAGIVAHDLKNPLASISMWAELLSMELSHHDCARTASGAQPGVPLGDAVRGISRASRRMALLIDRLLTQARSQGTALHLSVLDLRAIVGRVAAERRLDDVLTVVGSLPLVRADEVLVTQLLDNVIGNAAKYVAPGLTPRITVAATVVDDEVEVRVTDNGIGIPAAERPRVFEEFHRVHAGYEGTGLGLAICRVIVERHGGRIDVVDAPSGSGSCLRFTLPAARPS